MLRDETGARFDTTRWTLIGRLHSGAEPERREALEAIVASYWPPVYSRLRHSGHGREEAAELTQAFFADVVVARRLFDRAQVDRGSLRTLILTSLKHFLTDCHRRGTARPESTAISLGNLEHEEAAIVSSGDLDPDEAFDKRWARSLLHESLRRCEEHFRKTQRSKNWEMYAAREIRPNVGGCQAVPLSQIAAELGFRDAADAAQSVQTVKKRLLAILREVVAETIGPECELEEEFQNVLRLLS